MSADNKEKVSKTEKITLSIFAPEGLKAKTRAEHVILPGAEGDIMIMPEHMNIVLGLRIGILEVHHSATDVNYIAVSGGTASVEDGNITVSAYTAENAKDIDAERAKRASERAAAIISAQSEGRALDQARVALFRALTRLEAKELLNQS